MHNVNVLRFGPSFRQLFGIHHPPLGSSNGRAVLMCNPFGREAIRSHRLFRVLADRLARAGAHVLRFDYLGTGDSDGDDGEADLDTWIKDVNLADELLGRSAGVSQCDWFGLRLGGTMAVLASGHGERTPDRLVLLDPIFDGAGYVDELSRVQSREFAELQWDRCGEPTPMLGPEELLGFPMAAAFRDRLRSLRLDELAKARARKVHLIETGNTAQWHSVCTAWRSAGVDVAQVTLDIRVEWTDLEALNTAVVPNDVLQALLGAFEGAG